MIEWLAIGLSLLAVLISFQAWRLSRRADRRIRSLRRADARPGYIKIPARVDDQPIRQYQHH